MNARPCPRQPWESACVKHDDARPLPDFVDLSDEPQLASVVVLDVAARVVAHALPAHHGVGRRVQDELCDDPGCITAVLAHLIVDHCNQLCELIAAYRMTAQRPSADSSDDFPF